MLTAAAAALSRVQCPEDPSPEVVWRTLAAALVLPDRARVVKVCRSGERYPSQGERLPKRPPHHPTAALLFDDEGESRWLPIDLDPGLAGPERTRQAALTIERLLRSAGFHPFLDCSPRGGHHVWARLPLPQPTDVVMLLLQALRTWLSRQGYSDVVLDVSVMNRKQGCLALPASPCLPSRGGGHRTLVSSLDTARHAVTAPPDPRALVRLSDELNVVLGDLWSAPSAYTSVDEDLTVIPGGPKPVKQHHLNFLAHGVIDPYESPSEARFAALLHLAWRGWSLRDIRHEMTDGRFRGLREDLQRPSKLRRRDFLPREWSAAISKIRTVTGADLPITLAQGQFVHDFPHIHVELHGGEAKGKNSIATETSARTKVHHWCHQWLWEAEQWARRHYTGPAFTTMLAVVHAIAWLALLQDQQRLDRRIAELPVRSIHLTSGLVSTHTISKLLRQLSAAGAPLRLVQSGARTRRGSRFALRSPTRTEDDGDAAAAMTPRLDAVGPLWSTLGLAPWRAYTVLSRLGGHATIPELILASGLGRSCVYAALQKLRAHDLVEQGGDGRFWIGPAMERALADELGATQRYATALAQVRQERAQWKELLSSWEAPLQCDGNSYDLADEEPLEERPGVAETTNVDPELVEAHVGPPLWECVPLATLALPEDPYEELDVEARVIAWLEEELAAVAVPDTDLVGEVVIPG